MIPRESGCYWHPWFYYCVTGNTQNAGEIEVPSGVERLPVRAIFSNMGKRIEMNHTKRPAPGKHQVVV